MIRKARFALLLPLLLCTLGAGHKATPTVAILYFGYEGQNKEMQLLSKGLAQMLISDLSDNERYQIVERDRLQEIIAELKLNQSKKIDKSTANRIGKLLGARYMVMGGYFDAFGALRIDARVVEVETGKVLRSVGANGKPDDFLTMEQKLATDLNSVLSTELKAPTKKRRPRARKRPKPPKKLKMKTALEYAKALDAIDRKDKKTAKKKIKKVLEEQPDFALAQLDLKTLVQ